jgi:hypothetical protein
MGYSRASLSTQNYFPVSKSQLSRGPWTSGFGWLAVVGSPVSSPWHSVRGSPPACFPSTPDFTACLLWGVVHSTGCCPYSAPHTQQLAMLTDWARALLRHLPHYKWRADTSKRVAETGPRLANVLGKGRLSPTDFLPGAQK